jgi:hypothetical protein
MNHAQIQILPPTVQAAILQGVTATLVRRFGPGRQDGAQAGVAIVKAMGRTLGLSEAAFFADRAGWAPRERGFWNGQRLEFLRAAQGIYPPFREGYVDTDLETIPLVNVAYRLLATS